MKNDKILKIFFAAIFTVMFVTLLVMATVKPDTYALSAVVVKIDRTQDIVEVRDSNGNLWEYYGAQFTDEGQSVALLMNGKHTAQIEDDEVLEVTLGEKAR